MTGFAVMEHPHFLYLPISQSYYTVHLIPMLMESLCSGLPLVTLPLCLSTHLSQSVLISKQCNRGPRAFFKHVHGWLPCQPIIIPLLSKFHSNVKNYVIHLFTEILGDHPLMMSTKIWPFGSLPLSTPVRFGLTPIPPFGHPQWASSYRFL